MVIEIAPNDPLNLGFGYYLKISHWGKVVLHVSTHPETGKDLTLESAVQTAQWYVSGLDKVVG